MARWRNAVAGLLKGYATVLFLSNPWIGLALLAATFANPNAALAGLLAAVVSRLTVKLLSFPELEGLPAYNGALVGLSLGAMYQLNPALLSLIVLGGIMAAFAAVALADLLWRLDRLPALSLPFVLVALTLGVAAHGYGSLVPASLPAHFSWPLLPGPVDDFLTALGSAFFVPSPWTGLVLFVALLWASRYLAFLAVCGFFVGRAVLAGLGSLHDPYLDLWAGFNPILTAMALGGFFAVPGLAAWILAMLGAALSAVLITAGQTAMKDIGLPVMAIPYLLATLPILVGLHRRQRSAPPHLITTAPGLPEQSYERARLARARLGDLQSVPLRAPFLGTWHVYQGFNGRHTHQAPWQHALDFTILDRGVAFFGDGKLLSDYHCFGLPVVSPCYGTVAMARDDLPDNAPGEVDTTNNWGNFVVIRLACGLHVLIAHLQQSSLQVAVGQYLVPGQRLAACGNSGRSPQPHIHLHVQTGLPLGSPTVPFQLNGVALGDGDSPQEHFQLSALPEEGQRVRGLATDPVLAKSLHLPVGRELRFRVIHKGQGEARRLRVELTLLGQFRLISDRGASAAFHADDAVLAFYDRQGPADPFFDGYLLAVGMTPLLAGDLQWRDQPPQQLLPVNPLWRLLRGLLRPLGGGLHSHYQRRAVAGGWQQLGQHRGQWLPGLTREARTAAQFDPHQGCVTFTVDSAQGRLAAELLAVGATGDVGVPQWQQPSQRGGEVARTSVP